MGRAAHCVGGFPRRGRKVRVTRVGIAGLRRFENLDQPIAPVMVFAGPNGSGKTTIIGSVIYALTGRFPGVQGATAQDLLPLLRPLPTGAPDGALCRNKPYLSVTLQFLAEVDKTTQEVVLQRGISFAKEQPSHKLELRFDKASGTAGASGKPAETALMGMAGDVGWLADVFDPRRSFWNESPEKRMAWAFGLCAESGIDAEAWTRERVARRICDKPEGNDDFDPAIGETVTQMLELNTVRLRARVLVAQKVAREATRVAETIAAPTYPPAPTVVAEADAAVRTAHEAWAAARAQIHEAADRRAARLRATADAQRIERSLQEAKALSVTTMPPAPPVAPESVADLVAQLEDELDDIDFLLKAEEAAAKSPRLAALEKVASAARTLCAIGGPNEAQLVAWAQMLEAKTVLDQLPDQGSPNRERRTSVEHQLTEALAPWRKYSAAKKEHERKLAAFDQSVRASADTIDRLTKELNQARAGASTVLPAYSEADLTPLAAALEKAERYQQELRALATLAKEQLEQLLAAESAAAKADELKQLHERSIATQTAMMKDGLRPFAEALKRVPISAGFGFEWVVSPDSLLGVRHGGNGAFHPYGALSEGEKYRGNIALLLATSMVRRQPWRVLFLDGFERVSSDVREDVLEQLVFAVQQGLVDNVFVGCGAPVTEMDGVSIVELSPEVG